MKEPGSPEIISCIALNLNSHGSWIEMTSGTSSIRDPVLGRSSSLVVLRSVLANNSADSDQPHVPELVPMTGPTEGGKQPRLLAIIELVQYSRTHNIRLPPS